MPRKRHHIIATVRDKKGRVLAMACNSYTKTHPLQAKYASLCGLPDKQFLHAEVAAILRVRDLSKAHSIKVERYNAKGLPVCAKPCIICQRVIDASGIENVEWT
jgi:tRNA(Arg) A34 adenosine deaminase TadA